MSDDDCIEIKLRSWMNLQAPALMRIYLGHDPGFKYEAWCRGRELRGQSVPVHRGRLRGRRY